MPEPIDYDAVNARRAEMGQRPVTPYDTGEMLEPKLWVQYATNYVGRYGKVDFDNNEGGTEFVLCAYPSPIDEGVLVLEIDTLIATKMKVVINDGTAWEGPTE